MSKIKNKKYVLGQYFTREEVVKRLVDLVLEFKNFNKNIKILEPAFGTGNFIRILKEKGFKNIEGCEIDPEFTDTPQDFFLYPLEKKFDLIISNPPFTKYNIKESYFYPKKYFLTSIHPGRYLPPKLLKKEKIRIENAFILKSIKHLKDKNSAIGFVLPISFFIKGKNLETKEIILENFQTVIIYQNEIRWVDEPIPCCFGIFTNVENLKNKVVLLYENKKKIKKVLDKSMLLTEEVIPKSFIYRKYNHMKGIPLSNFLRNEPVKYKKSYIENNVSAANIQEKVQIPPEENVSNYCLAVVRVGNASVGRAGLINIKKDILNDMFYVFPFKEEYNQNKEIKERICRILNKNQDYFKNITFRVGSKSIKKRDILEFKI
jgi:type I restriction-modification system DNA methylase subunit